MSQIHTYADRTIAEVLYTGSSGPFLVCSRWPATAIAMHNAQSNRSGQRYYEWYCEIMNYNGYLLISFVMSQHKGAVLS